MQRFVWLSNNDDYYKQLQRKIHEIFIINSLSECHVSQHHLVTNQTHVHRKIPFISPLLFWYKRPTVHVIVHFTLLYVVHNLNRSMETYSRKHTVKYMLLIYYLWLGSLCNIYLHIQSFTVIKELMGYMSQAPVWLGCGCGKSCCVLWSVENSVVLWVLSHEKSKSCLAATTMSCGKVVVCWEIYVMLLKCIYHIYIQTDCKSLFCSLICMQITNLEREYKYFKFCIHH